MEKKINLIPEELTVPAKVVRMSKTISKASMVLAFILTIILIVGVIFFVYLDINYRKTVKSNIVLKQEITSLESVEQQLILTKDKIAKIKLVESLGNTDKSFIYFDQFKTLLTEFPDIQLMEATIDPKKFSVSLASNNRSSFVYFLGKIIFSEELNSVTLSSFNFNLKSGFIVNLIYEI